MEKRGGSVTGGALLLAGGAIVGAGLGLLFAPRSGRATRSDIARFAERAGREVVLAAEEASRRLVEEAGAAGARARRALAAGIERRSRLLRRIA